MNIERRKHYIINFIFLIVLLLYCLYSYNNYQKVLSSSSFFATVFIYSWLIILVSLLFVILRKLIHTIPRSFLFSTILFLLMLLFGEGLIRFGLRRHLDYLEINGQSQRADMFNTVGGIFPMKPPAFDTSKLTKSEFTHIRFSNDQGIFEQVIGPKKPGEFRILCMGDSFTEGVGATYEEAWVKHAEAYVKRYSSKDLLFINAGLSGSDPFLQFQLFVNRLHVYQPDWVVVVSNTSDIDEYFIRGGDERFQPDGSLQYRKPPIWYPLYRYSYIARVIVHDLLRYSHLLMHSDDQASLERQAVIDIERLCYKFDSLGQQQGFGFSLILHPVYHEVKNAAYAYPRYQKLEDSVPQAWDMLPYFIQEVNARQDSSFVYYWPKDGHFNASGYQIMGDGIGEYLLHELPDTLFSQ